MVHRRLVTILIVLLSGCAAIASEAATGQEASAEPNVFGGTWADALWTVVAFVALLIVLGRFAWKPLLKTLHEREEHIKRQINEAETKRTEADRILEEHKLQGQAILEYVAGEAEKLEREMLEKARAEAAVIKDKAQSNIEHARTAAARQLWEQTGDMLLAVGKEVLGRSMTGQDNQRLIEEAMEKLREEESGGKR
jgi:F-type H+-transporting ATPase subunit b